MKKISILSVFVPLLAFTLIALVLVQPVDAVSKRRARVLGASTSSSIQMPATPEGPGLILPDSPLFFLDNLKQNTRLLFAITSEEKAKVHASIAGERLAELRFMLAKNNKEAIRTAIQGVSDNLVKAAENVAQMQFSGKDASLLAKEVNQEIKTKQDAMDILESKADGELKLQVAAAQESLMDAKVRVEDSLPAHELAKEIQEDLNREAQRDAIDASTSAQELRDDLEELTIEASSAAKNSLKNRELVLRKAIEEKNEALQKVEERKFELEKRKQEKILELNGKAAQEIREIVEKAKKAAEVFQNTQEKITAVKNQTAESLALTNSNAGSTVSSSNKSTKTESEK
ncbi:hypothetical protein C4559_03850 [Candidatus Microgenomates bacterium]|nr:MAG: hypothetical protein C4559_03850 [Candidatus Microgenomates bacterium]